MAFCHWLTRRKASCYALPSEAAVGVLLPRRLADEVLFGDDEAAAGRVRLVPAQRGQEDAPGRRKKPNAWGLYDMHGNAREWCADWYDKDYYKISPTEDPPGPAPAPAPTKAS